MKQQVADIEIHFQTYGAVHDEGRSWVVLSHSLACTLDMWWPQLPELARRHRVLAFDTRGHGQSSAPAGPYTFRQLVGDLHGLLQALDVRRPHFLGLSMGGMIGQSYALAYPEDFASLIVADSASRWPESALAVFAERAATALEQGMEPLVRPTLGRWFTPPFHLSNQADVARVGAMIRATPPVGYAGCSAAVPLINTTHRLPEIKCPMLVMVGRDDPGTPLAMAREIHENAPGSSLVVIDNAAHLSNIEQAETFTTTVLDFLARVDDT